MNPMIEGRRADSDRRRLRVTKALADAITHNTGITVSGIAKAAAVDRSFLYRHSDLLSQVHAAAAEPHPTAQDGSRPAGLRCKPTWPTHSSGFPVSSSTFTGSKPSCPQCSARRHGTNPVSAPPPTSSGSNGESPNSSRTSLS